MITKAQVNEFGKVLNIAVFSTDSNDEGWIKYNDTNPAFIDGDYLDGYFYPPQPFASWVRDSGNWKSPIPCPNDTKSYIWNESKVSWQEVE